MARLLIAYATSDGHTAAIAAHVAAAVRAAGHDADLYDVADRAAAPDIAASDAAILAGSLHIGRHQSTLMHYVRDNVTALNARPTAFLSVSLAIASEKPDERAAAQRIATAFCTATGWRPTRTLCVAGAIAMPRYGWLTRLIMHAIAKHEGHAIGWSEERVFTDWAALDRFVADFLRDCLGATPPAAD
jgi:menaquinone-dependent protoporphyrinogen oxidase